MLEFYDCERAELEQNQGVLCQVLVSSYLCQMLKREVVFDNARYRTGFDRVRPCLGLAYWYCWYP